MKPHRGMFSNCRKVVTSEPTEEHLGFYLVGSFDIRDDRFNGRTGYTSMIVKVDGDEVETLNSRYTIVNCYNSDDFIKHFREKSSELLSELAASPAATAGMAAAVPSIHSDAGPKDGEGTEQ